MRTGLRTNHLREVVARLHDGLTEDASGEEEEAADATTGSETLYKRVARAKARWLRRVMYGTVATSTEKCFAYAIAEHLNCVTLDAWPGQARLTQLLGFKSEKTIQRAALGLEGLTVLLIRRSRSRYRYAPVFLPGDEDKIVSTKGQTSPHQSGHGCQGILITHPC
ncbi:MAG: hypothetical protein QOI12_4002 [Alphaproteobacteria bacterium]|nr:hypothetical protein [Alphaproteobacteria bacterium]